MSHVLVVAEKPSVAMSISKVLGAKNKGDGYTVGNGYIVSWAVGHLIGLAKPEEYNGKYAERPWKVENLPIIPDVWKFTVNKDTKKQFDVLKKLMNDANVTEIVCATDAAREGECIFRYVYNVTRCKKPFKRLWISSLEESAIKAGFNNLRPGSEFDKLYASGLCRAKADWLVGMNGTQLFSSVYKSFLSIGRVQTPTLAMIAERDFKVKNFIKEKYFTVELDCEEFTASSERIDDLTEAECVKVDCNGEAAAVKSVKREKKTVNPPKLYDLTTLQREANRIYGYTAAQTLDFTQSLYEKRLATYPRVDSRYITEDMAVSTGMLVGNIYRRFNIDFNPEINIKRVVNNAKVSDHHAILPTKEMINKDLSELPDGERNILNLLILKLLCAVAKCYVYEVLTAKVVCAGHEFTAKGRMNIIHGWRATEIRVKSALKIGSVKDDEEKEDEKALQSSTRVTSVR